TLPTYPAPPVTRTFNQVYLYIVLVSRMADSVRIGGSGTLSPVDLDPVPAAFLGTIQGAICGADHLVDIAVASTRFRDPNTNCNRDLGSQVRARCSFFRWFQTTVRSARFTPAVQPIASREHRIFDSLTE